MKNKINHRRSHLNPSGYVEPKDIMDGLTKEEFMERESISYGMDLGDSCVPQKSEIACPETDILYKIRRIIGRIIKFNF